MQEFNVHEISAWRDRRNMSQEELAERAQISLNKLAKIERGARFVSQQDVEKLFRAMREIEASETEEAGVTVIPHQTIEFATAPAENNPDVRL